MSVAAPTFLARVARFLGLVRASRLPLPAPPAAAALTSFGREPAGDSGRMWVNATGGKRPAPQSTDPEMYSPAGWSEGCDKAAGDPKVFAGLEVRADTILNADVRAFAPPGASAALVESAELVNAVFGWDGHIGEIDRGWPEVFGELFTVADRKGASLGEERWSLSGGVRVVADIEQRHLANLEAWEKDARERIIGVRLRKARQGREAYSIPLYEAADVAGGGVHFSFSHEGDPEGRLAAVLASVMPWVALKEHMTAQAWDGVSRWAMPVVKATLRAEVANRMGLRLDDPDIVQAVEAAGEAAAAFFGGESAALQDSDLVGFEPFGGVLDLAQWTALANLVDHNSLTAIGTPNLTMGVSATNGSRSAAETIDDLLLRSLASRLTRFLWQFRRQTVRRVVRFNLGPLAPVPLLVHEGIDVDGLGLHMGTLPHLVAAGIIDPTDMGDLRAIRRTLGLPAKARPILAPTGGGLPQLGNPGAPGPGRGNAANPDLEPLGVTDAG